MEAAIGIEPMYRGFADLCLTAWLRRRGRGDDTGLLRRESNGVGEPHAQDRPPERAGGEAKGGVDPAISTWEGLHSTTELFPPRRPARVRPADKTIPADSEQCQGGASRHVAPKASLMSRKRKVFPGRGSTSITSNRQG